MAVLLLAGSARAQLRHGDPLVTVVNTDSVNVRSFPMYKKDGKNTLIMRISRGTQMKRLEKRGDWYHVILPNGREAWVHGRYTEEGTARDLLEVRVSQGRVRRSSTTASAEVATVKRGDLLPLARKRNGWYLAILPGGRQGWIREDLVIQRPIGPPAEQPVSPPASTPPSSPEPAETPPPKEEKPQPPVDYYQRGLDYVGERRTEKAIEAFEKALELRPDDGTAHFELAKLLKERGDPSGALGHFRKALKGDRPRPEAKFHIDAILKAEADSNTPADGAVPDTLGGEPGGGSMDLFLENAVYFLPALAIGSFVFLIVLGLVYRRRRASRTEKPAYRRRKPDAGFDSVLKYAVEKRPLLRAIEEAERKQEKMDEELRQRFDALEKEGGEGPLKLPAGESSEALIRKVENLRQTILNQEERAQIYSDLVVLQNEKIEALDGEVEALKKLIQINYRGGRKDGRGKESEEG